MAEKFFQKRGGRHEPNSGRLGIPGFQEDFIIIGKRIVLSVRSP
jgi:hypothetical protein